jgi:ABC-type oligopeptide transport system substrate-binding subunit
VLDTSRGIFADPDVRRAAALALDRSALAAAWGELPTDQLLSAALSAFRDRRLYPLHASVAKARAIAGGRTARAMMAIQPHCDRCRETAHLVRRDLSVIGIDVTIRAVADVDRALRRGAKFDLLDGETEILYPDSASFLAQAIRDIPPRWVEPAVRQKVDRVARLDRADRQTAAAALADRLTARYVTVVAYGTHQTSQYIHPRIGCRVLTPAAYGLDLAALCVDG